MPYGVGLCVLHNHAGSLESKFHSFRNMSFLSKLSSLGHLQEALIHFNGALDKRAANDSNVDVARALFDGLDKLQSEWTALNQLSGKPKERKLFGLMFEDLLNADARRVLLKSEEMRTLAELEPLTTEAHENLANASHDSQPEESPDREERVVRWTAELLYIVRSNIVHGEKTPYGPDIAKSARDEQVCSCVVPLQLLIFDLFLERPSRKLLVYGTLAPGGINHGVISGVPGTWGDARVHGTIAWLDALPYLSWNPAGTELPAKLFTSDGLPNAWKHLDDFEGDQYKRRLVSIQTNAGIAIAYAYLDARAPQTGAAHQ